MRSNALVAMGASVLLIVASGDAEGDQAAAEPAADETEDEAEDPSERALVLMHGSHAGVTAMLALDRHRVVWPVAGRIGTTSWSSVYHDNLSTWLLHHGLSRLLHHGLAGLLHHRLSRLLHHRLSGLLHHRLLSWLGHHDWLALHLIRLWGNQRLRLTRDLTGSHRVTSSGFRVHLAL